MHNDTTCLSNYLYYTPVHKSLRNVINYKVTYYFVFKLIGILHLDV